MAPRSKTWLITGCSSGIGRELAVIALARGDTVVATARNPDKLKDLADKGAITAKLDVTASDEDLATTISAIIKHTGGIDYLINSAGYILEGGIEEVSRDEAYATFNTNVFGQLNMVRAVLPVMRAQKGGVVANLSSIATYRGNPGAGLYCATKSCVSVISEALRTEVAHLGIKVIAIEPGYTRTNFLQPGNRLRAERVIDDIRPTVEATSQRLEGLNKKQPNDPEKLSQLIVEAVTGSGRFHGRDLPGRLSIGPDAYKIIGSVLDDQKKSLEEWKDITTTTGYES